MERKRFSKYTARIAVGGSLFLIAAAAVFFLYRIAYAPNFFPARPAYVYIDNTKNFDGLVQQLRDSAACKNSSAFVRLARWIKYDRHMKTGKYEVKYGTSNWQLLDELRRGHQTAVRLTFNNVRFTGDLTQRLSAQLMMSVPELEALLADSAYTASLGFTPETVKAMFIPDTYEVYWNITPENLLKRMKKKYTRFWNEKRLNKANEIGLTPLQVATLASIVEEESAVPDEYPVIAGLYLNRLRRNIPLQADPTVKYAVGDFSLQRILFEHLETDSPYNTYKYAGLPPAPLRVPSIRSMEAVLNYMHHNYLYMCAKEDFSGRHNFAVTLAEHNRNANRYRAELNRRNIR
ncbi:MAG: endolytic transglycosylase MltG [Parabacteroides sp.]|nr:endolytic transglycosylase MltG [Parabacteroides sp.]